MSANNNNEIGRIINEPLYTLLNSANEFVELKEKKIIKRGPPNVTSKEEKIEELLNQKFPCLISGAIKYEAQIDDAYDRAYSFASSVLKISRQHTTSNTFDQLNTSYDKLKLAYDNKLNAIIYANKQLEINNILIQNTKNKFLFKVVSYVMIVFIIITVAYLFHSHLENVKEKLAIAERDNYNSQLKIDEFDSKIKLLDLHSEQKKVLYENSIDLIKRLEGKNENLDQKLSKIMHIFDDINIKEKKIDEKILDFNGKINQFQVEKEKISRIAESISDA